MITKEVVSIEVKMKWSERKQCKTHNNQNFFNDPKMGDLKKMRPKMFGYEIETKIINSFVIHYEVH